jgi:hypothetical protein
MIKLTRSFLLLSIYLFCSAVSAQEIPSDWSKTYVSNEWQGTCKVPGRGGCREGHTYYVDSDAGILVNFITYDQKNIMLFVASKNGSCVSGELSIEGVPVVGLAGSGDYCGVAGAKVFRDADRITNASSQLDIGMFRKAEAIRIDIQTSEGDKSSTEIPMLGFSEKLDAASKPNS